MVLKSNSLVDYKNINKPLRSIIARKFSKLSLKDQFYLELCSSKIFKHYTDNLHGNLSFLGPFPHQNLHHPLHNWLS